MKKLFLLAFMLIGTFAFGANTIGNHITEPEKAELNCKVHKTDLLYHAEGTLSFGGCVIAYDIYFEIFPFEVTDGTVVMGSGCENPGTYTFLATGETNEEGYITELDTFSKNEFISSNKFSEALRADLNKKL